MGINIIRVYLTGGKRIKELFDEGEKLKAKIRELRTAVKAQDLQMKGWGRDFAGMLRQIEEHKTEELNLRREIGLLKEMYLESEKARQSLGKKLEQAMGALELLRGTGKETETPFAKCKHWAPPPEGEASAEGGARA